MVALLVIAVAVVPAGATVVVKLTVVEPEALSPKNAPRESEYTWGFFQLRSLFVLQFTEDKPSHTMVFVVIESVPYTLKLVTPHTKPGPGVYGWIVGQKPTVSM